MVRYLCIQHLPHLPAGASEAALIAWGSQQLRTSRTTDHFREQVLFVIILPRLGFLRRLSRSPVLLFDGLEKFRYIVDDLLVNGLIEEISALVWHIESLDLSENIANR